MKEINESIAGEILEVLEYFRNDITGTAINPEIVEKMDKIEAHISTFQPHHLDEKDMSH